MSRVVQILENIESQIAAINKHLSQMNNPETTELAKAKATKKRAKKGVNQRLMLFLYKNPAAKDWPASQLAAALKCSKSAITGSQFWKEHITHCKHKTISVADFDQVETPNNVR